MSRFAARIEIYPHSSGKGQDRDQELAGNRLNDFDFDADNMREASRIAELIADGIETNPAVWQANVVRLERTAV
jgi:hypothetical protein